MASTKKYRNYVLEQLNLLGDISYKPMYQIDNIEDLEELSEIIANTYNDLK